MAAVRRDIRRIAASEKALADSALAELAVAMAAAIDEPETSATAKSMCGKVLVDVLERLHAAAPAQTERDRLDDLAARRATRRRRAS